MRMGPTIRVAIVWWIGETAPRKMKTSENTRKYVVEHLLAQEEAIEKRMEEKPNKLVVKISEFYVKVRND
jgi:hypothetical protein